MIELRHGNLLHDEAEALVNTVNCAGVMGKGIALQFKQAFPDDYFRAYEKACRTGQMRMGEVGVYHTGTLVNPKFIFNFPTKDHWKGKSRLEDIRLGLKDLVARIHELGIQSVALPPLGCGLGGLRWEEVRPLIDAAFVGLPEVRVHIYAPEGAPSVAERPIRTGRPSMTRARALFLVLLDRYGREGYMRTLLEVQKLAYFLQEAGENLRLQFEPSYRGPYAEAVNHVLHRMEGHQIQGYFGERNPEHEIALREGAAEEAEAFLNTMPDAQILLDRVAQLIEGFETPYGMELLATTYWVAKEGAASVTLEILVKKVHDWNTRKRRLFSADHIRTALRRLQDLGWVEPLAG